ncbi:hypothetical protein DesLBE_4645 [Desulfitobacterium sp. LBE]|nr:hypothetical protein DesLBE_4645 [Desulfitobacterium sp. LBE]
MISRFIFHMGLWASKKRLQQEYGREFYKDFVRMAGKKPRLTKSTQTKTSSMPMIIKFATGLLMSIPLRSIFINAG